MKKTKNIYIVQLQKKVIALGQELTISLITRLKTMTTTWCVKRFRINIKKYFLRPSFFSFHIRLIIVSLSLYIINIRFKIFNYVYNFIKNTFSSSIIYYYKFYKMSIYFDVFVEISTHLI